MNTTENNKIIAEFLEVPRLQHLYTPICPETGSTLFIPGEELEYHLNWNWLMEAVDFLENRGAKVLIGRMNCTIEYQDLFNSELKFKTSISSGVKINAVNGAVLEIIKWYKEQNQKSC